MVAHVVKTDPLPPKLMARFAAFFAAEALETVPFDRAHAWMQPFLMGASAPAPSSTAAAADSARAFARATDVRPTNATTVGSANVVRAASLLVDEMQSMLEGEIEAECEWTTGRDPLQWMGSVHGAPPALLPPSYRGSNGTAASAVANTVARARRGADAARHRGSKRQKRLPLTTIAGAANTNGVGARAGIQRPVAPPTNVVHLRGSTARFDDDDVTSNALPPVRFMLA